MNESLPRTVVPVPKIEEDCYDWYKRHESKLAAAASEAWDVVFFGDSITHFFAGEDGPHTGTGIWERCIAPYHALNLGFGFDRTQNVLWRIEHGELAGQAPKLFVINIGTNQFSITPRYSGDSPEDAAQGVIAVIRKLRSLFPKAHIAVMAVFPRGLKNTPVHAKVQNLNRILEPVVRKEPGCEWIDLSASFTMDDGELRTELFRDGSTHPNEEGYQIWADALEPVLKKWARTGQDRS